MKVYVVECPALSRVKVGISAAPKARLTALRHAMKQSVVVRHTIDALDFGHALSIERHAHKLLADTRLGGEWFAASAEVAIAAVDAALGAVARPAWPKPSRPARRARAPEQLSIRLTDEVAAELDRARGDRPRTEFVRSAMMDAIRRALPKAALREGR